MENKLKYVIKKYCLKNKIFDEEEILKLQNEMISKYNTKSFNFSDKISYKIYTTNKKRKLAIIEEG